MKSKTSKKVSCKATCRIKLQVLIKVDINGLQAPININISVTSCRICRVFVKNSPDLCCTSFHLLVYEYTRLQRLKLFDSYNMYIQTRRCVFVHVHIWQSECCQITWVGMETNLHSCSGLHSSVE